MRKLMFLAALMTACGGDSAGPEAKVPAELVGSWTAEHACSPGCNFTLTSTENPQAKLDFVTGLGISVGIDITSAGSFTLSFSGGTPERGTVSVEGSTMYVRDQGGTVDTIDYQVSGANLNLSLRRLFHDVDFNGDGQMDPARATASMRKR